MRLTLRTLLAYMDDILDPADQSDLARQVEESEKATELIHRTRDATRRLRLGAPPVIGEGMELDPNCVSEYLDNTMSPEDMTEFQQVCLDSDVHLAEVASCHHILTMVLGEPAQIDPDMRDRMYHVPERIDQWHKLRADAAHVHHTSDAAAAAGPAAAAVAHGRDDEPIREVPDYLKASEPSVAGRLALAFAAALVLGAAAYFAIGPGGFLTNDNQVAQTEQDPAAESSLAAPAGGEAADSQAAGAGDEAEVPTPDATNTDESPVDAAAGSDAAGEEATDDATPSPDREPREQDADQATAAGQQQPSGEEPRGSGGTIPPLPDVRELPVEPSEAEAQSSPDSQPAGDAEQTDTQEPGLQFPLADDDQPSDENGGPDERVASVPSASADGTSGSALMTPPAAEETGEAGGTPAGETPMPDMVAAANTGGAAADAAAPTAATADGEAAAVPPGPAPLGTLVGANQVLLRWNEQQGAWLRMEPRSSISTGDRLLSLPTYRPALALVSTLRVEFSDGAMLVVDFAADGATPQLDIRYGRFLLQNTGMESLEVELLLSGEATRVQLASTAVLGMSVDRPFTPGANLEEEAGPFAAEFYAPGGEVVWDVGDSQQEILEPSQWSWSAPTPASITDDIEWLNGQSLDFLEQNVSNNIERVMDTERPARRQLLEFYENSRRREERSLAVLCGTHVGQFVPLVQALADTQQQSNWDSHIAQLRRAMSRSPQAARLVRETLVEQRGESLADDAYAMLRGYTAEQIGTTPEEIQSGITRQLIDWLEHDRLEYRVLAFHNLKQIYGGKTLGYNPVVTERSRQERAVRMWRQRLADNELVPVYMQ